MKRAWCPGSMGELVQGTWEGKEVLISLTIDRFSEIEVDLVERVDQKAGNTCKSFGRANVPWS